MFTLLRFRFYPFLLIKALPIHIAPFSNRYGMKTIGVHIAPAKLVVILLFKTMPFVISCQKGANRDFEWHCNNSLLTKEYEAFSNVSVFVVHTENGSFSERTVFKFMRCH